MEGGLKIAILFFLGARRVMGMETFQTTVSARRLPLSVSMQLLKDEQAE